MTEEDKILEEVTGAEYKYGFTTDVESDTIPKGLNEDVIRLISKKKEEPQWLLEHRLKAFERWYYHRNRSLRDRDAERLISQDPC